MSPESKCVSLGTAKALQAAGFPQDTERMWEGIMVDVGKMGYKLKKFKHNHNPELFAAPDSQELGELLPTSFDWGGTNVYVEYIRSNITGYWKIVFRECSNPARASIRWEATNEAEARAACWLWLKKQKLI